MLGYYSMIVLWLASIGINSYITVHYGLRAGGIVLENYWIVDAFFSKPWTKLFAVAYGLALCKFYHSVLDFRKSNNKHSFTKILKMHRLKKTFTAFFVLGFCTIVACLYCGFPGISHPYSWSYA